MRLLTHILLGKQGASLHSLLLGVSQNFHHLVGLLETYYIAGVSYSFSNGPNLIADCLHDLNLYAEIHQCVLLNLFN